MDEKEKDIEKPVEEKEKEKEQEKPKEEPTKEDKAEEKQEKPVEEKAEEPKKEEKVEDSKELTEALAEVQTLTTTVETLTTEKAELTDQVKEYESLIEGLVETKMEQVPEEYRDLIPENLTLPQKLDWINKLESKGLFNKEEKKKPEVEVGKPLNTDAPAVNMEKLTIGQKLAMAYSGNK